MTTVRDLIYFDFAKAASLYSQIEGGLVKETQVGAEESKNERSTRNYELPFFKPQFGGSLEKKETELSTRVLHHDLLGRLEEHLFQSDIGLDLVREYGDSTPEVDPLHSRLEEVAYVRASGWSVIEDFDRLKNIAGEHNRLCEFIGRCTLSSIEKNEAFRTMMATIDAARRSVESIKDRNKRSREERKLQELEQQLQVAIAEATGMSGNDEWLLEGISFFIDLFMPGRVLLSVYPYEDLREFHVLANLKRDCFVDGDLDTALHAYGNRPNVKLTVVGLITSIPGPDGSEFQHLDDREDVDDGEEESRDGEDEEKFELGFRRVFQSFDGYYKFLRYSRYPNITVHTRLPSTEILVLATSRPRR